jgi:hypothetical protein
MCPPREERQGILEQQEKFKFNGRTRRWEIRKGSRMKKIFLSQFFTNMKFAILKSFVLMLLFL